MSDITPGVPETQYISQDMQTEPELLTRPLDQNFHWYSPCCGPNCVPQVAVYTRTPNGMVFGDRAFGGGLGLDPATRMGPC